MIRTATVSLIRRHLQCARHSNGRFHAAAVSSRSLEVVKSYYSTTGTSAVGRLRPTNTIESSARICRWTELNCMANRCTISQLRWQQQIRTFARPKRRARFKKFLRWKADLMNRGLSGTEFGKYRDRPVDFLTQLKRLLNKATRDNQTKWFLQHFIAHYRHYSQEKRYTEVIPHLSVSYRQKAMESLFPRIMREITVENNHGTNGFVWMIQFREELMELIFRRSEELKTLTRKVKLMRLKLTKLNNMKLQIRKDMGDYIFWLCSQPLPKPSSPEDVMTTTAPVEATTHVNEFTRRDEPSKEDYSREVPPEYRSGPVPPPTPPIEEVPKDWEMPASDEPRVLGWIRRLQYSDLSTGFLKRCVRAEPSLAARFRGSNKRVYGWFQDKTSSQPDVLIYVAFLETVPKTMEAVLAEKVVTEKGENFSSAGTVVDAAPEAIEEDVLTEKEISKQVNAPPELKVAAFYGSTILHRALENIGIGEYCVRPIMEMLQEDEDTPSSISTFATLSPIYKFRHWLLEEKFDDDIRLLVVNEASEDFLTLAREWNCPNDQVFSRMKSLLARSYEIYREEMEKNQVVATAMNNLLLRCASSYIVKGKTPVVKWRCNPLELSTRFLVAQGASVFRLNLAAALTEADWAQSFGIRTNFILDLNKMKGNQEKFNELYSEIDFHKNVTQYVPKPCKLRLTKEQRERWLEGDPIRKKMVELSKDGKLFRVPLHGPPTINRKIKPEYPSLVPRPIRPPIPLPPPVPMVGVSGLSISLKAPPPKGPSLPSYVARTLPDGMPGGIMPLRKVGEGVRMQSERREKSGDWPFDMEFSHDTESFKAPVGKTTPAGKKGKKKSRS